MNSIFVIAPYKYVGSWVFDDPNVGLVREAFVSGADTIMDELTREIPGAAEGFRLIFSPTPFPGHDARFVWNRQEFGGNWYAWPERGMEGWLCPALFRYFEKAPRELYVSAKARA